MNLFLLLSGLGILFVCICVGIAVLKHEWFSEPALTNETLENSIKYKLQSAKEGGTVALSADEMSIFDSEEFNQPTDLPKFYDTKPEYETTPDKVVAKAKAVKALDKVFGGSEPALFKVVKPKNVPKYKKPTKKPKAKRGKK